MGNCSNIKTFNFILFQGGRKGRKVWQITEQEKKGEGEPEERSICPIWGKRGHKGKRKSTFEEGVGKKGCREKEQLSLKGFTCYEA